MKSPVSEFCDKRGIPEPIKDAFNAYLRNVYSTRFLLRSDTETVRLMIGNLKQEQIEQAWGEFVKELKRYLT